jgi:poly-gamma-glutamate synthesis protein (capsule biosynthesis protein)
MEPPVPKPAEAEIVFAGDAMQHAGQIAYATRHGNGTFDYADNFSAIANYVSSADYAVVNFEASLGGKPYTGYPCFSAPDAYAEALKSAGFDLFLLANNHILDRRDKGLHRTISVLDSLCIPHVGIYHNAASRSKQVPFVVDINGFKLGILNYTYATNGITIQGDAVVNYIDRQEMAADIAATRKGGAELVAVCVHWGEEYKLLPNRSQRNLADWLVEQGVDLIIGGHPHVIQPMEMRTGPGGSPVLLVYSLGNFISNMKTTDTRGGAMVRVKLLRDSVGHAYVADAAYSLVFTEPDKYHLIPADKATDSRGVAFRRSAEAIFSKHNKNVRKDENFLSY